MGIEVLAAATIGSMAVSAGSAYMSNKNAKASVKAQNQALAYQQEQNSLASMRQKRDAIRQARIARAQVQTTAATQGVSQASSAQGGQGSIVSQLNDTLSFLDTWNKYSDAASTAIGQSNVYARRSQMYGTVAGLAMSAATNMDVIGSKVKKIFGA